MVGGTRRMVLALGLSVACGPGPSEVVAVYDGNGTSSSSDGGSGSSPDGADTGPIADGSGSATTADGSATMGITTQPDPSATSSTGDTASTGAASTSGPPDPSTTTGASPSCDELFGTASGYLLCSENEDECQFGVNTGNTSCNMVCASFGQTCLGALDNPGGGFDPCFVEGTDDCTTVHGTEICICSK